MGSEWLDQWERDKEARMAELPDMEPGDEELRAIEDEDFDEDVAVDEDRLRRYDERG